MRQVKYAMIVILTMLLCVSGCGDVDLLDEVGQRYTATLSIKDLDQETLSIDVIQSDCDGTPEDFFPVSAAFAFAVSGTAAGVTLTSYVIEYVPLPSEDGTGTIVMPPILDGPLTGGNLGIDIATGGSAEFEITCMSVDTKEEYRRKVGWIYCSEDATCNSELQSLDTRISDLEDDIDTISDQILVETDPDALQVLEDIKGNLIARRDELTLSYFALLYSFAAVPELQEARYRIRITLNFEDTAGTDQTVIREATVWLGNFDNC
ncbi:MAG: hypothetical protein HKP58_17540 [Desulfatitalea sp.]|nr:hypothetical protein [Desulfatitalea sp.]NNK02218.1 hypothetical protein [Desulfatitalea sp.]